MTTNPDLTIHTYPWKTTDARDLLEQRDRLLAALEGLLDQAEVEGWHEDYLHKGRALIAECRAGTDDAEREAMEDDLHGRTL